MRAEQRTYRAEGLILRSREYSEADHLLTILTRERGKIGAIAKGVRKPSSRLRAGTQVLTHSQLLLSTGRNLHVVTQAEPVELFQGMQGQFDRYAYASYMAELVDRFTMEQGGSDLFVLLLTCWHLLTGYRPALVARLFELRLLLHLGYAPDLAACGHCGRPLQRETGVDEVWFSRDHAGLLGRCCAAGLPGRERMMENTWSFLRYLATMDPRDVGRLRVGAAVMAQATAFLQGAIRFRLEGTLRSWAVLDALCLVDSNEEN
ncbi:DNA repair protein RecO [Heliophilum fasciatum]|uniref:DNA repair protein RecO n=1 Tax=Heliophilum fasciatum TaxID=35700 RepID=A0A4R2RPD5_9FIRM|nr:DNA repair protein RecO [Heliophilum fasciatum]MCW2278147.1 DNA repair protein RecO (recombination protein O) [Heliophilum fasciatum]TCP64217.1 DNA replication and repair protein RecO [Heliophilum fasciatum]